MDHFHVFEFFYCCRSLLIWFFVKYSRLTLHFYDRIKQKTDNRFLPPIKQEKKIHGNFPNQSNLKDSSVSGMSKFFEWYNYWLYTLKYTSRLCTSLVFINNSLQRLLSIWSLCSCSGSPKLPS